MSKPRNIDGRETVYFLTDNYVEHHKKYKPGDISRKQDIDDWESKGDDKKVADRIDKILFTKPDVHEPD